MELIEVTTMQVPLLKPGQVELEAPSGAILADLSLAAWNLTAVNLSAIAKVFTHADGAQTCFMAEVVFLDMNSTGTHYPWRTYRIDGISSWDSSMAAELGVLLKKQLVDLD